MVSEDFESLNNIPKKRFIEQPVTDMPELGEFSKFINTMKVLSDASKSDLDKAISSAVSTKLVEQVVPSLFGGHQKSSFLDSGFMQRVGDKIPDAIPTILDVLLSKLGQGGANKLVDTVQFMANPQKAKSEQNMEELILSMNPDDPSDQHKFMALSGIDNVDTAKKELLNLKKEIFNKYKQNNVNNFQSQAQVPIESSSSTLEQVIGQQNEFIKAIAEKLQKQDEAITFLMNKINEKKEREVPEFQVDMKKAEAGKVSEKWKRDVKEVKEEHVPEPVKSEIREPEPIVEPKKEPETKEEEPKKIRIRLRPKKDIEEVKEETKEPITEPEPMKEHVEEPIEKWGESEYEHLKEIKENKNKDA